MQRLFHIVVLFAALLLGSLGHISTTIRPAVVTDVEGEVRNAHLWEREQAAAEFSGNGPITALVISHSARTTASHNGHSSRPCGNAAHTTSRSALHLHQLMREASTAARHFLPHPSCDYFIVLRHIIR